jgi:hypothetical protein
MKMKAAFSRRMAPMEASHRSSRGRRAALVAGVGLLALAGVALAEWRPIAVGWHLAQMSRDREAFNAALASDPGSVRWDALRRYLQTDAGAQNLLRGLLLAVPPEDLQADEAAVVFLMLSDPPRFPLDSMIPTLLVNNRETGEKTSKPSSVFIHAPGHLWDLFAVVSRRSITLPAYPGLRLRVLPSPELGERFDDHRDEWAPYGILIERAP